VPFHEGIIDTEGLLSLRGEQSRIGIDSVFEPELRVHLPTERRFACYFPRRIESEPPRDKDRVPAQFVTIGRKNSFQLELISSFYGNRRAIGNTREVHMPVRSTPDSRAFSRAMRPAMKSTCMFYSRGVSK